MAKKNERSDGATAAAKPIAVGDTVHLVTARGGHVHAVVKAVGKRDTIDLEAESLGVTITNSPMDPLGKQPDSWHRPEEVVEPATVERAR